MFKYGVFAGPGKNMGKYGPQKTLYLDTSRSVNFVKKHHIDIEKGGRYHRKLLRKTRQFHRLHH